MFIDKKRPGTRGVGQAVSAYSHTYPDHRGALEVYGRIMVAQQEALESLPVPEVLNEEVVDSRLRQGMTLIEPLNVQIDQDLFLELVANICEALGERVPVGFADKVLGPDGLAGGAHRQIEAVLTGGSPGIFEGEDDDLASRVIFEALVPFFENLANEYQRIMDWSIWKKGECPVCGSPPLMGKFREGDGLWILECSLCRAAWSARRARCPFCDEDEEGSLDSICLDRNDSHRVMYCPACRRYIKTVDLRDADYGAILALEDIVTAELDKAAANEHLKPA